MKSNTRSFIKRVAAVGMALVCAGVLFAGCGGPIEVSDQDQERTQIIVYNWGDYIDSDTLAAFEDAHPEYEVVYREFESNETMYPALSNTYDVIIPSEYMIARLLREDKIQPLDRSKLPNVDQYMNPLFTELRYTQDKEVSDKMLDYAIPYLYCTVGLVYDANRISVPEDSTDPKEIWSVLFDPENKNTIGMYDAMRESIGAALNYLGYSINTTDAAELQAAEDLLLKQKSEVSPSLGIDNLKDKLANGELAAAEAWSGDHLVILDRIEELGKEEDIDLRYALPEGSNWSVDMMAIPKNAKNVEGAHAFINFMYEPEIALANCEYVGYSTPNTAAFADLPEDVRNNVAYYPDNATFMTLEPYYSDSTIEELYTAIWNTVKASS